MREETIFRTKILMLWKKKRINNKRNQNLIRFKGKELHLKIIRKLL